MCTLELIDVIPFKTLDMKVDPHLAGSQFPRAILPARAYVKKATAMVRKRADDGGSVPQPPQVVNRPPLLVD